MRDNPSRFKINIQNLFQVSGIIAISRDQYGTFSKFDLKNRLFVHGSQPFM